MSIPEGSEAQELIPIVPFPSAVKLYHMASVPPAFVALPEPTVMATSEKIPGRAATASAQVSPPF